MIDCHCHLADAEFDHDLADVILRAKNAGVESAVVCAEFKSQFQKVLDLAQKYPDFVRPALGVHPVQEQHTSVTLNDYEGVEAFIRSEADKTYAIGEVGLDFTPRYLTAGDEDKKVQREVLKRQIELSKELDLPLNVHSRSAGRPVVDWLIENGAKNVLLHAFSGNVKNAEPGIQAGFYFSVPPSFTVNKEKIPLIQRIPVEQLCLESDSPVLGPSRTERNEPKNVRLSAEFIAEVKKLSVEDVIRITTENAKRLFKKLK